MGLFNGSKIELQTRILELEKQVAIKDELLNQKSTEVDYLRKRMETLQDAIIAIEHPTAYRQLKDDQFAAQADLNAEPVDPEKRKEIENVRKINQDWINGLEDPLFRDADDMMSMLSRRTGISDSTDVSVHGNDES